jgi:hypothetical protein
MASHIGRRKLLATLGGAAAWPLAGGAQQAPMPRVGFVTGLSSNYVTGRKPAFNYTRHLICHLL